MANDDTIVAAATAPGESAVAVTRLSGPEALALAARHFRGARSPLRSPSHRILFGSFVSADGAPIDTVLLSVFRAPHSYTGEDVAEISSHGGSAVPRAILEVLVRAGARPARPGEFTERAFRNGKLDLGQAESVAAVVRARSDRALKAAHATLEGELSRRVGAIDAELVSLLAEVESRIDFPGDVREEADREVLAARTRSVAAPLRDWLARIPWARRREEGLRVALVGAPNVGKSSLLNALVGHDRAIVSEEPGTTRDTVESSIWLGGTEIRLIDTAGVRDASEPVERLGVERAARAARGADLALIVLDALRPEAGARECAGLVRGTRAIVVWNKVDLARPPRAAMPAELRSFDVVETVAVAPGGVDALIDALRGAIPTLFENGAGDELPGTSARQEGCIAAAVEALDRAERQLAPRAVVGAAVGSASVVSAGAEAVGVASPPLDSSDADRAGVAYDVVAVDLTEARRTLGEIAGRGVDDAVVAEIFARFCIGK